MEKLIKIGVGVLFLLTLSGAGWAAVTAGPYNTTVAISAPTEVSLSIVWWTKSGFGKEPRTLPSGNTNIDFTAGLTAERDKAWPGRTSWDDSPDDGFKSVDGNVGFTAVCVGPNNTQLTVQSGQLTDGTNIIPYADVYGNGYYGFTATYEDGTYWAGGLGVMQPYSVTGFTSNIQKSGDNTKNIYGHEISITNMLRIPANLPVGAYSTPAGQGILLTLK